MDDKTSTPTGAKGFHETYPLALNAIGIGTRGWTLKAAAFVDMLTGDGKKRPPTAVPKGHDAIVAALVRIANHRRCGLELRLKIGDAMGYVRAEEKRHAEKAAQVVEALLPTTSTPGAPTTGEEEAHAARVAARQDGGSVPPGELSGIHDSAAEEPPMVNVSAKP